MGEIWSSGLLNAVLLKISRAEIIWSEVVQQFAGALIHDVVVRNMNPSQPSESSKGSW